MHCSFQVTIDSNDPHVLAEWWAQTLDWPVEAQDEAFIRSMVEQGHATEEETTTHRGRLVWRDGAALVPPEGSGAPRVLFVRVPEAKTVKNRMHLDLRPPTDDLDGFRSELERRGAIRLHEGRQGPHSWVTYADPEGNEFCA